VRGQDFDPPEKPGTISISGNGPCIDKRLIPPLIRRIRSAAPDIRLEVSQWQDRAYEAVIEGKLDAAFSAEHPPSALQSEVLFEVDFVCVVGGRSKEFDPPRLTPGPVFTASPMWWSRPGAGEQTPVDRPLAQFRREAACWSSAFHSLRQQCSQFAKTDLVLTVPRKLTKLVRRIDGVRLVETA